MNILREFAPDTAAFDEFVAQWYFDVVVPGYRVKQAETRQLSKGEESPGSLETTFSLRNFGRGRMPVEAAVVVGDPFDEEGQPIPDYRDARKGRGSGGDDPLRF